MLSYLVRESHRIVNDSAEGLLVASNSYSEEPPGGAIPRLRCTNCGDSWDLPQNVNVLINEDGKTKRLFGPNAR